MASYVTQIRRLFDLHDDLLHRPPNAPLDELMTRLLPPQPDANSPSSFLQSGKNLARILLIVGASGSGKSTLLKALQTRLAQHSSRPRLLNKIIRLDQIKIPDKPVIDLFPRWGVKRVLELLARVGLAEARTYLLTAGLLSQGQLFRLVLALAVYRAAVWIQKRKKAHKNQASPPPSPPPALPSSSAPPAPPALAPPPPPSPHCFILADEFASSLDAVTAHATTRGLRNLIAATPGLTLILATTREELAQPLQPDLILRCDFAGKFSLEPSPLSHLRNNGNDQQDRRPHAHQHPPNHLGLLQPV